MRFTQQRTSAEAHAQVQAQATAQATTESAGVVVKDPNTSFTKQQIQFSKWALGLILSSVIIFGCVVGALVQRCCMRVNKSTAGDYGRAYQPPGDNL